MECKHLICDGWQFAKFPQDTTYARAMSSDAWQAVDVPHDWLIGDVNHLYESGEGWYKRILQLHLCAGERAVLRFMGVYMDATVYVNGKAVFQWKYGYSTFDVDITENACEGANEIVIQCRYASPNTRWYSGAGLYREVFLYLLPAVHFAMDGIYVTTKNAGKEWQVLIQSEIINACAADAEVCHTFYAPDGGIVAETRQRTNDTINAQILYVDQPLLWDTTEPNLYRLESKVESMGEAQTVTQHIGFKTLRFTADQGLFLNGKHKKLHGVCLHHDLGALGAAMNKAALRRQLAIMQEMGVNAVRTSHNMPAKELMELCDEMGILVLSEAFDMWENCKTEYDYARFFPAWAERDVRSWVRRDRNHASLLMWSLGNEIYDTYSGPRGHEVQNQLMQWVRQSDPLCHALCTTGNNYMPWENAQKCAEDLDVVGYNYGENYYAPHHAQHPHWVIYGSETYSIVQSRGVYHFPIEAENLSDDDLQCSSLGNSNTSWGAKSRERCITDDRDADFCLGQFIWSGFDYIGEPTPYHTKNSYFGLVDTAGFPKDAYYAFKSAWTDGREKPFVHLYPYWDFNEGQLIDVQVSTNLPRVRLFVNGRALEEKQIDHAHGLELIPHWKIPYERGSIRAEAYDENGNFIVSKERHSFGDAAKIIIEREDKPFFATGEDLAFLTITVIDNEGNPVENANNRMHVTVSGAGRLMGLDNGDSTDLDDWQCNEKRLFAGKLLVMVGSTMKAGVVNVSVSSPGLAESVLCFESEAAQAREGVSYCRACNDGRHIDEIPIRKIVLSFPEGTTMDKTRPFITATAEVFPKNATADDLCWRVTNALGIDSPLVSIHASGHTAKITARGDGDFYVRCMANNGASHPRIISQMEGKVSGFGEATINPYAFVSGGLCTLSRGEIGPGNERGVSTARDGDSMVGFENVDFGRTGAQSITLSIFALDSASHAFELWLGDPQNNGQKLIDAVYQKPSIWNVYQDETYRLPVRITGKQTLCLVAHDKMHIKGFVAHE